jgi:large subunit ribosomal protein L17
MRKMVFGRQLSRGRKSREALFRSLIKALVLRGKITTTKAKAKAVSGQIDKLLTQVKTNTVSSRRRVLAYLANGREATAILFDKIGPSVGERTSGFTRIIQLPRRLGDNAQMVRLEWVDEIVSVKTVKEGKLKEEKPKKKKKEGKKIGKKVEVKKAKTIVKKTIKTNKVKTVKKKGKK